MFVMINLVLVTILALIVFTTSLSLRSKVWEFELLELPQGSEGPSKNILVGLEKYLEAIMKYNDELTDCSGMGYYAGTTLFLDTEWGHLAIPSQAVLSDNPHIQAGAGYSVNKPDEFQIDFKLNKDQQRLAAQICIGNKEIRSSCWDHMRNRLDELSS